MTCSSSMKSDISSQVKQLFRKARYFEQSLLYVLFILPITIASAKESLFAVSPYLRNASSTYRVLLFINMYFYPTPTQ